MKQDGCPRTIDAIVYKFIHGINLCSQLWRIIVESSLLLRKEIVKRRVQNADYLRRLIVHNSVLFLVP